MWRRISPRFWLIPVMWSFWKTGRSRAVGRRRGREGGTDEARAWELFRLDSLAPIHREVTRIEWDMQAACKDGYKHFMLKEIMEQPGLMPSALPGACRRSGAG